MNKILLSVGATGIATAGGGGLYFYFRNNKEDISKISMSSRLTSEGFKPLNLIASDPDLKVVLAKYKVATKNTFEGKASEATEQTLITQCTKIFSEISSDETNYKLANQWCVKEFTIDEIFKSGGWKTLNTDGNEDTEGQWAKKIQAHKESQSENKLVVTLNEDNTANISAMKNACKALKTAEIKTTDLDFNTKFEQVKEWCAIKQ